MIVRGGVVHDMGATDVVALNICVGCRAWALLARFHWCHNKAQGDGVGNFNVFGWSARILTVAALLVIAGCGNEASSASVPPISARGQQTGDAAADFVHHFHLGSNLERMALTVASSTQTYAMVSSSKVASEIHRLTPKYQAQWDANLAKAYAAHMSQEELHSLANEGRGSPFYPNMEKQKDAISADMQEMSKPILEQLVTEALTNAFKDR